MLLPLLRQCNTRCRCNTPNCHRRTRATGLTLIRNYGELGTDIFPNSAVPVAVSGVSNAIAVAASSQHSCALLGTGSIACWEHNDYGELGDGTTSSSSNPVAVTGVSSAIAAGAGDEHTCVVLTGGAIQCWGYNLSGQLGNSQGGMMTLHWSNQPSVGVGFTAIVWAGKSQNRTTTHCLVLRRALWSPARSRANSPCPAGVSI
jgi:alpha-tubulin suppressor-like RCC1 family protein